MLRFTYGLSFALCACITAGACSSSSDGGGGAGAGASSGSSEAGGAAGSGGSSDAGVANSSADAGEDGEAAGSGGQGSTRTPAAPAWVLRGKSSTWEDYSFTMPPSMDVIEAGSKGYYAIGRTGCAITFFPPVDTEADADAQAKELLVEAFSDPTKWSSISGIDDPDPLLGSYHHRTVTAQGLSAVDLSIGMKDPQGRFTEERGRILLVDLGTGKSAAIIGYQTNSGVYCLNEVLNPYEWVLVFYSLSFPQARPANPNALRDTLIGEWFTSESGSVISTGLDRIYAANGNYSYAVAVEQSTQVAPNLIRETTSTWAGDGAWRLDHGLLEILPREAEAAAQTNLMRIFAEYNASAENGWIWYLYTLDSCGTTPCETWARHY